MKIFVELTDFATSATSLQLRERVHKLEDLGATGISVSDHMFVSATKPGDDVLISCDPLTTLGAVAGASSDLAVGVTVMNAQWINPALLLRQFTQLAVLLGGERVLAGLGVGWNPEEFKAIGEPMPSFRERIDRLEEVFQLGRELFDTGVADFSGTYVTARDLPISPRPQSPPRLMAGGGSTRILEIAGRYCDVMDMHGDVAKYGALKGRTLMEKHDAILRTIIQTTNADTAAQVEQIRQASIAAGRPADSVEIGIQLQHVIFTKSKAETREVEEVLCRDWGGVPYRPLDDVPAVLIGDSRQMADLLLERQEQFDLQRISIKDFDKYAQPGDQEKFLQEVMPLLQ